MSLNKKIGFLLDNGFKPNFVSSLNEGKINLIYERLKKKKETKEQVTPLPAKTSFKVGQSGGVLPPAEKGYAIKKNPDNTIVATPMESEMTEEDTLNIVNDPDATADGMGMFETELSEKFESKAQQGLFWARCNKCKSDDCKWCKMAKEFSKSTSKKEYKKMPEKKHPEKTVKYKKKKNNEEFTMANYFDKVASVYANNAIGKTIDSQLHKEQSIKKHLGNLIENNLKPTMKKRDLLKLIESEIQKKRGLNENFYFEENEDEIEEDFMMGGADAPVKTPERVKPKRETEPSEPEWEPGEEDIPNPSTEPEPQAKDDEHHSMMSKFKSKFKMDMDRLDSATHKPHRFKKY